MRRRIPILLLAALPLLAADAFTDADYTAHLKKLQSSLPQDATFTILLQKPFVIIGDGTPAAVKESAEKTVQWAADRLKKEFFDKDPPYILDIYLFKDRPSYDKYTLLLFRDKPDTPYGYFSPTHKALIMNIATGGGTLVHELVHPFVAANFPDCPTWFNEGLGSLFEQCTDRNGRIAGLTNWRLEGLQKAIKDEKLPTIKDLFALDQPTFYGENRGINYAFSRYLLYYLQEKNLLKDYYEAFLKNREKDPTGYATFQAVIKEDDMPAFQKRWERWVMTLTYP